MAVAGYRIDAIGPDGRLVEIQTGSLGRLRGKLGRLLDDHPVRVVKPVVVARWLVRRARPEGADLAVRRSPKRGALVDLFDDLVGLAGLLAHPNLMIEALGVEIDEVRVRRRRWPGHAVVDRRLRAVAGRLTIEHPSDLWRLLPEDLPDRFTTRDLADRLGRSPDFARKVAYCLRLSGAAQTPGKSGHHRLYGRPSLTAGA